MFVTQAGPYAFCFFLQLKLHPSILVQLKNQHQQKTHHFAFQNVRTKKSKVVKFGEQVSQA